MGVNYLTSFIKQQKLQCQINILDEIQKYHAKNGSALIIFDVMGFVHNFGANVVELNLGGRQHIYMRNFERFLKKLQNSGATLVFICDGQLQSDRNDEWCRRRDAEFQDAMKLINEHSIGDRKFKRFGCKTIVKSLLKMVKDKDLGKVIISTQVDCDKAIAKYAVSHKALAVVANDSDFIIFEGDFQWWSATSIQMYRMTANRFERNQLRHMLGLTSEQLKYLATIAGNDHTKHNKRCDFMKVSDFCRSIDTKQSDDFVHRKIQNYMDNDCAIKIDIDSIVTSIKSYDIDFEIEKPCNAMDKYCSANVLMFAFINEKVFQYEANFLDYKDRNNHQLFLETLLDVLRKLGGILLKNESHRNPLLKIVTKYSLYENYMLKEHTPIFPQGTIDIEDLIFGDNVDDKWNLLLWSLGMDEQLRFDLEIFPKRYVHTVLALKFLFNAKEISSMQADVVLMCQYDIEAGVNVQAIKINESAENKEVIRVGHLFNRTVTLIWDCFMVCGLDKFIKMDWYDGSYFNHLLTQCQHSKTFHTDNIRKIRPYRLYATQPV